MSCGKKEQIATNALCGVNENVPGLEALLTGGRVCEAAKSMSLLEVHPHLKIVSVLSMYVCV